MTLTTSISGMLFYWQTGSAVNINICIKFEVSIFTCYTKAMKGRQCKMKKLGGFGGYG